MASSIRDKLKRVTGPRSVERSANDFFDPLDIGDSDASGSDAETFRASATATTNALPQPAAPALQPRPSPAVPGGIRTGGAARGSATRALDAWRERSSPAPDAPAIVRPAERPQVTPPETRSGRPSPDVRSGSQPLASGPCFHVSEKVTGVFHRYQDSACFVVSDSIDGNQALGAHRPADWLSLDRSDLAEALAEECETAGLDPSRALFFDLETNGFKAASGCVPFVIGTMRFRPGGKLHFSLIVMHSPDDEAAALDAFCTLAERASMLVTFNGARFDVPFLRECMQRQRMVRTALNRPHVDLYRLAKARIGPRGRHKLTLLEERYLGIHRDNDLPGSEAPRRWASFRQTGIAEGLLDVISHNRYDLWTMPALAAALLEEPLRPVPDEAHTVVPLRPLALNSGAHAPATNTGPAQREILKHAALVTEPVRAEVPDRAARSQSRYSESSGPAQDTGMLRRLDSAALGKLRRAADAKRASDPDEAIQLYERLSNALPTDAESHAILSELYQRERSEFATALRHAMRASSLAPWSGALQRRVDELKRLLQ